MQHGHGHEHGMGMEGGGETSDHQNDSRRTEEVPEDRYNKYGVILGEIDEQWRSRSGTSSFTRLLSFLLKKSAILTSYSLGGLWREAR